MAESAEDPELFWVDPRRRGILPLDAFHVARRLRRVVRQHIFEVRCDSAFTEVILGCSEASEKRPNTWINDEIVRLYTGRPAPYPSVEEAESYPYNAQEVAIAQHAARRSVVGTPEQVRERLVAMVADYQADELIVVTITHDFKARMRSYELLAEAFGLDRRD